MNWRDAIKHTLQQNKETWGQALQDAWQGPQNLIGLAQGYAATGELPTHSMDPEGNREFRFKTPGQDPLTVGSVISADPNIAGKDLAHERVHTRQSRETGPMYIPSRVLGEQMSKFDTGDPYFGHPMEHEAYLETGDTDDVDYYLKMVNSMRRMNKGR